MQLAVLGGSALLSGTGLFKVALLGASVAGSMIMNGRKKPVGKLNDLRVSSSSYGRGIAKVWGTQRVTGNMFWATDFREEKKYIGQKGKQKTGMKGKKKGAKGKATPVYKYYANFAMGLCEGPMDDVLRIWADNNLIYNKLNPDDEDLVKPGFSQRSDDNTGKSSQKSAGGKKGRGGQSGRFAFRFYHGDEDQLPDRRMEKEEGVGKVPAYRDLCYLMFEDFALEDFGNRIPTITAEVTSRSVSKAQILTFQNNPPPEGGYYMQTVGSQMFDLAHNTIVSDALLNERTASGAHKQAIRSWDMDTRKEKPLVVLADTAPQQAKHESIASFGGELFQTVRTWDAEKINRFRILGNTPNGDIVMLTGATNYSPIAFVDPNTGMIVKTWGVTGNLYDGWGGIFVAMGAFPIVGSDPATGKPTPFTVIWTRFGEMHLFDADYNKVGYVECSTYQDTYRQGSIGTTQGILMASTNFGGTDQYRFYTAPVEGATPILNQATGVSALHPFQGKDKLLGVWPKVKGSRGGNLFLHDMAYIVGANCVGIIAGNSNQLFAVKMDILSGEILWEQELTNANDGGTNLKGFKSPGTWINTNYWNFHTSHSLVKIDFRNETFDIQPAPEGVARPTDLRAARYYWSERDAMIGFTDDEAGIRYPVVTYQDRKIQSKVSLSQIATDVATAVGIDPERIVTTNLATQEDLIGYMYEQPVEARSVLQELANVYMFDCVESDNQLRFKMRGSSSLLEVDEDMLGVIESDVGSDNERFVETLQQQLELPERVTVSYYDPKNDYETGQQYFKRPSKPLPVMSTREHLELTFNMALLADEAKAMAKRILYAAWSERSSFEFRIPRDFLALDASDVIQVNLKSGRSVQCRLTDVTIGANFELEVVGVNQLPQSYTHKAVAGKPQGLVTQPYRSSGFARAFVFDIPYLDDEHETPTNAMGFYWGAGANGPGFNYGMLQSRYADTEWATDGTTQLDALWGFVKGPVPSPARGWNIEDDQTRLTLVPAFKFNDPDIVHTWESVTDAEWPSTQNMILIDNEIILFKDVSENPDGSITISRLIRGYRGSIDAAYAHGLSSTWTLMLPGSIHFSDESTEYLNKEQSFIVNTGNLLASHVSVQKKTLTGGTERPLPVGDVRRINRPNGDLELQWSRATRIGGALKDGTDAVPLNEESEQYRLFVLPSAYDAKTWNPDKASLYLWKSDILTSSKILIPSQTLSTIGLSNKRDINVVIHQLSAKVGWGFPTGVKLSYSMFGA